MFDLDSAILGAGIFTLIVSVVGKFIAFVVHLYQQHLLENSLRESYGIVSSTFYKYLLDFRSKETLSQVVYDCMMEGNMPIGLAIEITVGAFKNNQGAI